MPKLFHFVEKFDQWLQLLLKFVIAFGADLRQSCGWALLPHGLIQLLFRVEAAIAVAGARRLRLSIPSTDMLHVVVKPVYHQLKACLLPFLIDEAHQFILYAELGLLLADIEGGIQVELVHLLNTHVEAELTQYIVELVQAHQVDIDPLLNHHVVQQIVQILFFLLALLILGWFEDQLRI